LSKPPSPSSLLSLSLLLLWPNDDDDEEPGASIPGNSLSILRFPPPAPAEVRVGLNADWRCG
jgi:hypothetical protein